ncbi:putative [histone H3]-lysine(4) N-trimethyltransferase [Helianthus debilis subsp. tardiflorus]
MFPRGGTQRMVEWSFGKDPCRENPKFDKVHVECHCPFKSNTTCHIIKIRARRSSMGTIQMCMHLAEYHARAVVSMKSKKRPSLKARKQKLLSFLQEKYKPICAKWTTERCVVCRWIEDWDYNKIIICISAGKTESSSDPFRLEKSKTERPIHSNMLDEETPQSFTEKLSANQNL